MKNREAYLAIIDLDCCAVIQSTGDNDQVTAIDCINLPKGSTLEQVDKLLDEAGYEVARFDHCGETFAVAIVCCTTWEPIPDSA